MPRHSDFTPALSPAGSIRIEADSPVQAALALIERLLSRSPRTDMGDLDSARAGEVIGNHFCVLLRACGSLNASGLHSASLVLFRSLQDALDVFAAVTSVTGAARSWERGELKPSDAAKAWVANRGDPGLRDAAGQVMTLSEYRRAIRSHVNRYSHGSYALCTWDLYFLPRGPVSNGAGCSGTLDVNSGRDVIDANAHSIDANMTATLLEFIAVFESAYTAALTETDRQEALAEHRIGIEEIMMEHTAHGCQDMSLPAEIRRLREGG